MTTQEYILEIARKEGSQAFRDEVCQLNNPYDGVSHDLYEEWLEGWYDMFYSE